MEEFHLSSWKEFTEKILELQEKYSKRDESGKSDARTILFRGQANADWNLQTTLERATETGWGIRDYAELVLRCAPEIETYTQTNWNLPKSEELQHIFKKNFSKDLIYIPNIDFWVYLRHHGLPSPLLDWTLSPYIAAFFAFHQKTKNEQVAVYAYIERPQERKVIQIGMPSITVIDKKYRAHKRHFLQQGSYTICTRFKGASDYLLEDHFFCPHESIFDNPNYGRTVKQDIICKIMIPTSERLQSIEILNQFNINEFSLMQTEDSLMRTLGFREIELN